MPTPSKFSRPNKSKQTTQAGNIMLGHWLRALHTARIAKTRWLVLRCRLGQAPRQGSSWKAAKRRPVWFHKKYKHLLGTTVSGHFLSLTNGFHWVLKISSVIFATQTKFILGNSWTLRLGTSGILVIVPLESSTFRHQLMSMSSQRGLD